MIEGNLNTTNILLGIIAAVSVLQAVALVVVAVMAYRLYGRAMQAVREIEQRQIAPLAARVGHLMTDVEAIAADVKRVTERLRGRADRVDGAIDRTLHRVDETADRVRSSVSSGVHQLTGLVYGAWCAVEAFFNGRRSPEGTSSESDYRGGVAHGGL